MTQKTLEQHKAEIEALPEEEQDLEIRIRVDQVLLEKLKEHKKTLDAPSYNSALRTLLGVPKNKSVVDVAVAKIQANLDAEKKKQKGGK